MDIKNKLTSAVAPLFGILAIPAFVIPSIALLYALWMDIKQDHFGMFVADMLFFPWGVIHGIILFFSH